VDDEVVRVVIALGSAFGFFTLLAYASNLLISAVPISILILLLAIDQFFDVYRCVKGFKPDWINFLSAFFDMCGFLFCIYIIYVLIPFMVLGEPFYYVVLFAVSFYLVSSIIELVYTVKLFLTKRKKVKGEEESKEEGEEGLPRMLITYSGDY
jgi:hypothetical protein